MDDTPEESQFIFNCNEFILPANDEINISLLGDEFFDHGAFAVDQSIDLLSSPSSLSQSTSELKKSLGPNGIVGSFNLFQKKTISV